MTATLQGVVVSGPDATGRRRFHMRFYEADWNAVSTGMGGAVVFTRSLRAYGRWIRITKITMRILGANAGVTVGSIQMFDTSPMMAYEDERTTATANDSLIWADVDAIADLDACASATIGFGPTAISGYAATDDYYMLIDGEVW